MSRTAYLLVNPHSGGGDAHEEVSAAARGLGVDVHTLAPGDDAAALARAATAEILGMGGGDGSLAAVAAVAVERGLPFVCVPLGTRNHFARDVGLDPLDPLAALDAFASGVERAVDVGRANGRLFLNNVSLGSYARLVHHRERRRRRQEALARLRALATIVARPSKVELTIDGEPVEATVVLVANNAYRLDLPSPGERDRLDEGRLHLYVPTGLLHRSWSHRSAQRLLVDTRSHRIEAALDGEPELLQTPIEFTIEPRALRVLVPRIPPA